MVIDPPANAETEETRLQSLGWEDPLKRAWQPTLEFFPGESCGQRSLVGYSPWGCKKLGMTEATEHACVIYQIPHINDVI